MAGIDYENNAALHPRIMLANAIARGYESPIASMVLPEVLSLGDKVKEYPIYYDNVAASPSDSPPGTEARITSGYYSTGQVTGVPYRLATRIDEWTNSSWMLTNVLNDATTTLYNMMMVQQEYDIITALADTTTYTSMGNSTKTSDYWDDNIDGDPIKDIKAAKKWIKENSKQGEADTLIIDSEVEAILFSRPDIQRLLYQGGQMNSLNNGRITRLLGLDVFVTNTITKTAGTWAESSTFANDEQAMICQRGESLGITHVAEPEEFRRWALPSTRSLHIELLKTFKPHIWRQTRNYVYKSVLSD